MRGPGSIPTSGNIFHWIFLFSHSKTSAANINILFVHSLYKVGRNGIIVLKTPKK